jgi:hypothetical protein
MSSARASANQGLYLAKIVLESWQELLHREIVAAATVEQAFLPAVRSHLLAAYGWFLLELSGTDQLPQNGLPTTTAQLPTVAPGKVRSGELRELQRLEQSGWLAQLLQEPQVKAVVKLRAGSLAHDTAPGADISSARQWTEQLEGLYGRMRDSLDEY